MNLCQPSYRSGPASLFAVRARTVIITCPHCLSENTEMVDHEHDIYQCLDCGDTFERRIPSPTASQDGS